MKLTFPLLFHPRKMAYIPNYEVAAAYDLALQTGSWSEVANSISKCDELLDATRCV